ncbi:transcriptional regulator [Betaproteobacteria bacterium GR16-43]|nr:transcriptional regulator [Betaproteobacteria bacterium GR16-43]
MTSPAGTYDELQAEIGRRFPTLSRQLQRIARFALERPQDVALDTVAAAATKVEVQPSAMVRFAQALGYDGYTDMQRVFRDRLVERSHSYRERIATMRKGPEAPTARPNAVLRDFVADSIANLSHLEEHVPEDRLREAVRLLARAPRIHLLAQRRAFPVACYLSYALAQLELPVTLMDGVGGMVRDQARTLGPEDVLVAISFRNYSPDVIEIASDCHRRGIPVIVITDSSVSPLYRSATVAFELGDPSDRPFRSLVEPICLAQSLVVSVGHELDAKARTPRPARTSGKRHGK